ncbi:MAG: formate/nitrite transporter family protein [Parasporobacterium sp.]|nr:formate/nitrite transporter family protein [Parasporobacterium sp.]
MISLFISGIAAGILISIGGTIFLSCDIRYIGALLFSVALLCICYKGYSLFTGKIGFIPEKHDKEAFSVLLLGLLGNAAATVVCGFVIRAALPAVKEAAFTICSAKLEQSFGSALVRGIFCGILMYLAVSIYRDKKTIAGIVFCIPVFILCGFEHSIADMFYFAASGIVSLKAFGYIWLIIVGNAVGGMILPVITGAWKKQS